MNSHFQSFRLHPPHAPPSSGHTSCSGRAWPPIRFLSLSAVLRTSLIARSLVSRIKPYRVCIAALVWAAVLRTVRSLPVALHKASLACSYFQLLAGSSAKEGLPPSGTCSLSSARARRLRRFIAPNKRSLRLLEPALASRTVNLRFDFISDFG